MDEQQQRIAEDLAGLFHGELRFDTVAREIYSTDASIYQIHPLGVAYPKHRDDVSTLTQYASENEIPLIPRGAGSGLAGGALGRGIIVDCSRYLTQIEQISDTTVRVQAGVVRNQLNQALRPYGRYFAPDPASTAVTTVGGMLAVDAAGSRAVRVGSVRDHIVSIETVFSDGSWCEVGKHHRWLSDGPPRFIEMVRRVNQLVSKYQSLIEERQPRGRRNCSGYHLSSIQDGDRIDLARLLVGSEGTLGIFTGATLNTLPLPEHCAAAFVLFRDLEPALEAVQQICPLEPSACDLLDRRLLSLAREADPHFEQLIPANAEAGLIIEQHGLNERHASDWLQGALALIRTIDPSAVVAAEAHTFKEVEAIWTLPYRVVPLLNRLRGESRALPFVEDISVRPEVLRDFLVRAQKIFQKHWLTASLYAHAASGQVHFRPFMKPPSPANANQIESLSRELYEVAVSFGGTISGEHGNGLARTAFLRTEYGPLYRVFQEIKQIFDPKGILNPEKIISNDAHLTIRNLRPLPLEGGEGNPLIPLQLQWQKGEFADTIQRCNGCGDCRRENEPLRMCPFFHLDRAEEASPRSKASLMRSIVTGIADPKTFSTDEAKQLADNCFNCKQCHRECPSQVDIPALAIEAKAQCVSAVGLSNSDYILSRAHSFGRLGCRISPFANWAIAHSGVRWLMEKFLGISRHRRLPKFSRGEFLRQHRHLPSNVEAADAVFFLDHFVNYHDHELGNAFLRIMDHHGLRVAVPQGQVASGMAMISVGDLDAARELAETNVGILAEYAREGRPILCTEPTAVVCLKYEYPRLLDKPDVHLVAENTFEAGTYLKGLRDSGKLRTDFAPLPLDVRYHTPCHLKYLGTNAFAELMTLIPEMKVQAIDRGCSGMAGAFGLSSRNYETSMKMGERLLVSMQESGFHLGTTECSSCRMQMEQQSSVATLHPVKLMAMAYGLMPELNSRFPRMSPAGLVLS